MCLLGSNYWTNLDINQAWWWNRLGLAGIQFKLFPQQLAWGCSLDLWWKLCWCFYNIKASSASHWREQRNLMGTSRRANPRRPKGYSRQTMACSGYKAGGRGRKGGMFSVMDLSHQVTVTDYGALLAWEWLNTCLPLPSGEGISSFPLLVGTTFLFPFKLFLSQSTSFLNFIFPFSSQPHPKKRGMSEWDLVCGSAAHRK